MGSRISGVSTSVGEPSLDCSFIHNHDMITNIEQPDLNRVELRWLYLLNARNCFISATLYFISRWFVGSSKKEVFEVFALKLSQ